MWAAIQFRYESVGEVFRRWFDVEEILDQSPSRFATPVSQTFPPVALARSSAQGIVHEERLPDGRSYGPAHEVGIVFGSVADEVRESKLPGLKKFQVLLSFAFINIYILSKR